MIMHARWLRICLWIVLAPTLTSAAVYKCRDPAGQPSFSDRPCPGAESVKINRQPSAPTTNGASVDVVAEAPYQRPRAVAMPPLPPVDLSSLPTDAAGNPILVPGEGASIVAVKGPPGPLNVLAACSALVTRCVHPGIRSLDACFMSAPRCADARPWAAQPFVVCCPATCWESYEALRIAGKTPLAAYDKALFGSAESTPDGCVPMHE